MNLRSSSIVSVGALSLVACAASLPVSAFGQIVLNVPGGAAKTENFDSIGTSATAGLPTNFKVDKQTTARTVGTYSTAVSATERRASGGSTITSNGIYNFASGSDIAGSDRAVGWLASSGGTVTGNLYGFYQAPAQAISGLNISYNVEKYRNGSNSAGFQVQLYYSTDGSAWTNAGSKFLTAFAADPDNNVPTNAPSSTTGVSAQFVLPSPAAASSTFYLAWSYSVQKNSDGSNAQALGVDDISVQATPEPTSAVLLGLGSTALLAGRRRAVAGGLFASVSSLLS